MRVVQFTTTLVLILTFAGCVSDETQQQWRADQAKQALAMVKPIEGTYSGNIASAQDGANLGSVSLTIKTNMEVQTSADGLSSEQHVVVQGHLDYKGIVNSTVQLSQAFYDETGSGSFRATLVIQDAKGNPQNIDLYGTIASDRFVGRLEAENYPAYGGTMTLIKNAPVQNQTTGSASSARAKELSSEKQIFVGDWDGHKKGIQMTISEAVGTTTQERFLNIFLPTFLVQVNFDFGTFQLPFANSQLDDQNATLHGQGQVNDSSGNAMFPVSFDCDRLPGSAEITGWKCTIAGEDGLNAVINFTPAKSTTSTGRTTP